LYNTDMNILNYNSVDQLRSWLKENCQKENECYVLLNKGKFKEGTLNYIDVVYAAISFGFIDNVQKVIDGVRYVRLSRRVKNSSWTELNKERARYLIKHNLMEKEGLEILPSLDIDFKIPEDIKDIFIKEGIYERFINYPSLYQRIRISYISSLKTKEEQTKALNNLIKNTKLNKMIGMWNDYGRLGNE